MIIRPDFLEHWKTRMLCAALMDESAPLLLLRLWAHCQIAATDRIANGSPEKLKSICKFAGDAAKLLDAMTLSEWVVMVGTDLVVCNWKEANAGLFNSWENGALGGRPSTKNGNPRVSDGQPLARARAITRNNHNPRVSENNPRVSDQPELPKLNGGGLATSETQTEPIKKSRESREDEIDKSGVPRPPVPATPPPEPTNTGNPRVIDHPEVSNAYSIYFDPLTCKLVGVTQQDIAEWSAAFPAVDVGVEILRAEQWLKDNQAKRKKLVRRFLTNWMSRSQERGGGNNHTARNSGKVPFSEITGPGLR